MREQDFILLQMLLEIADLGKRQMENVNSLRNGNAEGNFRTSGLVIVFRNWLDKRNLKKRLSFWPDPGCEN